MALLAAQSIVRAGLAASYAAVAGGGDEFVNTGVEFVHIKNDGIDPTDVTFATPRIVDGLAVAELVVTVAASADKFIGPFPKGTFNDGNGRVQVTYSETSAVEIAVLSV